MMGCVAGLLVGGGTPGPANRLRVALSGPSAPPRRSGAMPASPSFTSTPLSGSPGAVAHDRGPRHPLRPGGGGPLRGHRAAGMEDIQQEVGCRCAWPVQGLPGAGQRAAGRATQRAPERAAAARGGPTAGGRGRGARRGTARRPPGALLCARGSLVQPPRSIRRSEFRQQLPRRKPQQVLAPRRSKGRTAARPASATPYPLCAPLPSRPVPPDADPDRDFPGRPPVLQVRRAGGSGRGRGQQKALFGHKSALQATHPRARRSGPPQHRSTVPCMPRARHRPMRPLRPPHAAPAPAPCGRRVTRPPTPPAS
jgi:hypothetical protein